VNGLLLLHGTIVTVDADRRVIENGAVAILGDRIVDIGTAEDLEPRHLDKKIVDCRGKLIIPGIIDAHGHAGHALIRSIAADTYSLWMRIVTPTYYHARAYSESGLREVVCVGPAGLPWPHAVTRWESGAPQGRQVSFEEMIEGTEATIEALNGSADGRIDVFVTPFTIVPSLDPSNPTTPDLAVRLTEDDRMQARRVRETARKWGVRIHSDAFAGQIRMAFQDKENALLGPDVHLQHCWGISHEEVDILAATGTHVTHAPPGRAVPLLDMMSKGVPVAITSDGVSPSRHFDMFQIARLAQFTQHLLNNNDRYLLPPGKVLEMITIDAARALGKAHEIGSLEVGKKADVAIINMRQPHLAPNWMVVHRLIHQVVGSDVDTVIVDGKVLMREGRVLTVDVDQALDFGEREAQAMVDRAGLKAHMHDPGWGQISRTFREPIVLPDPGA
jgi:cytosine/adenosine deaminase-related metal-dependent hydrolase